MNTPSPAPGLTLEERKERDRLHRKWAAMQATRREILRAMELDHQAAVAQKASR